MKPDYNQRGKTLLEYVLIVVLIAVVSVIAVFVLERFFGIPADEEAKTAALIGIAGKLPGINF